MPGLHKQHFPELHFFEGSPAVEIIPKGTTCAWGIAEAAFVRSGCEQYTLAVLYLGQQNTLGVRQCNAVSCLGSFANKVAHPVVLDGS